MKRVSAKRIIEKYFCMLTDGCGNATCDNDNCVSSGKIQPLSPNQAAALAVNLFRRGAELCVRESHAPSKVPRTRSPACGRRFFATPIHSSDVDDGSVTVTQNTRRRSFTPPFSKYEFLTETEIGEIVKACQNEFKYSRLKGTILRVFSKADTLSKSFLKSESTVRRPYPHASDDDLVTPHGEKLGELGREVDEDVYRCSPDSPTPSSTIEDSDDEIELDLASLRRSYEILFQIPGHVFEKCLLRALKLFAETCEMELKVEMRDRLDSASDMEKYAISFLIVFEMPSLSADGRVEYVQDVLPLLCKSMSLLPDATLARICRVWARHCRTSFKKILQQLHAVITSRTISSTRKKRRLQDDVDIVAATKIMKVLYYSNALAGEVESPLNTKDEDCCGNSKVDTKYRGGADAARNISPDSIFQDRLAAELQFDLVDCTKPYLPFSEFYNELLSTRVEMDEDYTNFKSAGRIESESRAGRWSSGGGGGGGEYAKSAPDKHFSFMSHPFVLTPATKTLGLFYDNRIRMYSERRASFFNTIGGQPPNPYLKLRVRRDHLIEDTLRRLEMISFDAPQDFNKQLVIEFEGEQGMDEGGVSKEFFQLFVEEIFNPDYGMFTCDPDTQLCWFNTTSFENDSQYMLVGLMLGLAIYNSIILDVHFPMVVYKKLLGKKGTFSDLEDFDPVLYNSLKCLLKYADDDVEEVYSQTFRITYKDAFGSLIGHDLMADGDKVAVSLNNKQQFVNLYADFLLNKSVAEQFNAFRKGFRTVTDESPLKFLFRPEEIEILVCGSKNFDLYELQETTRYDGGYEASTSVIQYFWEFVHSLCHTNQRKLLQFTTGSDRVPVGGLGQLRMIVARNGPDSDRLPTAHTCFNVLLLPEYCTKEKLFDRMMKAINYSKGFGML